MFASPNVVYDLPASSYVSALSKISPSTGELAAFFNRIFVEQLSPQDLTWVGLFESLGIHDHNRYLDDLSIDGLKRPYDLAKSHWITLQTTLPGEDDFSKQVVNWNLLLILNGEKFFLHQYFINQMRGVPQEIASIFMNMHPLNHPEDVENYVLRLEQIPIRFKQLMETMDVQRDLGITAPRFAIEKSIAGLENWISSPAEKHLLISRLKDQPDEIVQRAKTVVANEVIPAYQELIDYLKKHIPQHENGVWALPDGDAFYEYCLKKHTTLDISAEEIHEIGLREVARIEKQMEGILKQEGLWKDGLTVGQHMVEIGQDPKYYFPNTDEGREACLKRFEEILERSRKILGPLFADQPKSPVIIKRVPSHEENGAPGAYYMGPSFDGTRPGMFFANLSNLKTLPMYKMETLVIHEAEPGHHFQIAWVVESDLHILRKNIFNAAYMEGWALYAESLAYEQGFYSSPLDQIGHLNEELFRAARLVVDTGIHWKRWSKAEALDYFSRVTGNHIEFATAEVERYFVYPGQACSYKMGQLKILEARKQEQERLKEQFNLVKFHSDLFKNGVVPLSML
ncbi:MAG: DUF885 domain-containing protein [Parachlamydiales bacterium]|nr:DUF885 domain-containing protein [Parachlamydiales bacterium]